MKIRLSNGAHTLIDAEDAPTVRQYAWRAHKPKRARITYAVADLPRKQGHATIMLHRLVMGFPPFRLDHKNLDGLDNRKQNLRRATRSQNSANKKKPRNNTSGFKGVSWHKRAGKWRAYIKVNQKWKHLGLFTSARVAARVYKQAAQRWFGEFART